MSSRIAVLIVIFSLPWSGLASAQVEEKTVVLQRIGTPLEVYIDFTETSVLVRKRGFPGLRPRLSPNVSVLHWLADSSDIVAPCLRL